MLSTNLTPYGCPAPTQAMGSLLGETHGVAAAEIKREERFRELVHGRVGSLSIFLARARASVGLIPCQAPVVTTTGKLAMGLLTGCGRCCVCVVDIPPPGGRFSTPFRALPASWTGEFLDRRTDGTRGVSRGLDQAVGPPTIRSIGVYRGEPPPRSRLLDVGQWIIPLRLKDQRSDFPAILIGFGPESLECTPSLPHCSPCPRLFSPGLASQGNGPEESGG